MIAIGTGALLGLVLLLVAVGLATLDDESYRAIAIWGAEHFAGWQMTVEGPFQVQLSGTPSLSAGSIRFAALPGGQPPPLVEVGYLKVRMALMPLLRGLLVVKDLEIDDVRLAIEDPGFSDDPESPLD